MKLTTNNIWITSDTHYSHTNLVRGQTSWKNEDGEIPIQSVRDFESVEIMNDVMVNNINQSVDSNDWLIHLGDWSFGGFDRIKEFRDRLNCKNIVLIMGNHDHHIQRNEKEIQKIFSHVSHYEEMNLSRNESKISLVLCHYPIISWNGMYRGSYMLHGHQHLKGDARFGQGRRMDVGICGTEDIGFRPYHIEEIFSIFENK
jgi:calcineurin-like phosphoesterase family protein